MFYGLETLSVVVGAIFGILVGASFVLLVTKQRLLAILIALDIFILACITLGGSRRNETISSCLWTLERDGKLIGRIGRPVVDWLFSPLEANHCATSYYVEYKLETWGGDI